jgi:thiaminase/transcriptional activator TenA
MPFSNRLRALARPIWEAQLTHPFVRGLGDGTLPERKFKFYILQDARFLGDLARVFAAGAQKAPDAESALRFARLVEETIVTERGLHESYGTRWKLTPARMTAVPMAPTNYAYTRHMLAVAQTGTAAEITVVALPCAWIYCVVGRHLLRKGPPPKGHPYRDWLMLYASPEFAEVQRWMRRKVDEWAPRAGQAEQRRMEEAFLISSRYEWMFWEMAWNEEQWPV